MLDKFEKIFIETNNEWGFVVLPNNVDENIPLVLHFHGNGGYVNESGADWIDEPRKQKFFLPVLESGFAIAGCHGTGNHWGRKSSLNKLSTARREDKRAAIHKVPGAILFRKELSDPMAKGKKVKTTKKKINGVR